jgi:hypothetical protein
MINHSVSVLYVRCVGKNVMIKILLYNMQF